MNFYGVLTIVVVLGFLSVVWARYDYRNGSSAKTSTSLPPLAGTTSYSGLGIDVCGALQPSLPATKATSGSLLIGADGLVQVSPSTKAEAGLNANVEKMAAAYPGMEVTSQTLKIPATSTTTAFDLTNGDTCPSGTPDAGKKGVVVVGFWVNFATSSPMLSSNPAVIRLTANSLATVAFLPSGSTPPKPSKVTINRMLYASQSGSTTPTTARTSTGSSTTSTSVTTSTAVTTTTAK
jgi:hypothetical protein